MPKGTTFWKILSNVHDLWTFSDAEINLTIISLTLLKNISDMVGEHEHNNYFWLNDLSKG